VGEAEAVEIDHTATLGLLLEGTREDTPVIPEVLDVLQEEDEETTGTEEIETAILQEEETLDHQRETDTGQGRIPTLQKDLQRVEERALETTDHQKALQGEMILLGRTILQDEIHLEGILQEETLQREIHLQGRNQWKHREKNIMNKGILGTSIRDISGAHILR